MLPINWNTAIQYANLVKIAESVTPSGSYGPSQIAQITAAGYTFLQTLYGDDLATDMDPHLWLGLTSQIEKCRNFGLIKARLERFFSYLIN